MGGGGDSLDHFMSRTGSTRGVQKQNGELVAKCHKTIPKSYNAERAGSGMASTMKESFKDPNMKAKLTPYHWNALRNRLPVEFKDAAIPGKRFCAPRNNHTYDFFSGNNEAGYQRFRTTMQNYYAFNAIPVGETNQGIVSENAKIIHAKQRM